MSANNKGGGTLHGQKRDPYKSGPHESRVSENTHDQNNSNRAANLNISKQNSNLVIQDAGNTQM